jgi:hypothetical protein
VQSRKQTEIARTATPESRASQEKSNDQAQFVSKFSPETPTIVITPALDSRLSPEQRSRVASSVYSRLTSGATPPVEIGNVPPLPQNLPALLKKSQPLVASNAGAKHPGAFNIMDKEVNLRESTGTTFEEDFDEKKVGRIMSSDTLFEEDQQPMNPRVRSAHDAKELTIDTAILPTPHRSRGWWDLIRTPFENARSFSKFGRSPTDGERTLEVPAIPPLIYYTQPAPAEGLGLTAPRNTHNSQALRRLESRDQLKLEPVPPLPAGKRGSALSTFSPNEREVPLMLHVSPIDRESAKRSAAQSKMDHLSYSTAVASNDNGKSPLDAKTTPESVRSEFSPVGQVIGEGEVVAAKGIVQHPPQTTTQPSNQVTFMPKTTSVNTSLRSSLTAEVVKASPKPPPLVLRSESRWPAPAPYFAPPPTYPHEPSQGATRQAQPDLTAPFPPTRFSSFDDRLKQPKERKLRRLLTRKKKKAEEKKSGKSKRRRWCCLCCCLIFFILVLVGVVLGVVLSRQHKSSSSTEATWFNVTNYPPIPGGILTVARPNLRTSVSGCVNPQAMWSCAVPKEEQDSIMPNDPNQPNFVFDIRYDNSSTSSSKFRRSGSAAPHAWKTNLLLLRDSPVLQASPKPPALEEYAFLGNTTDGVSEPFEGEATPFYISFKPPSQANFRKFKRHEDDVSAAAAAAASTTVSSASSTTSSAIFIPNLSTAFPKPEVNSDGTAQAANLLPFPSFQPLRLFNRGKSDEHYGFYTYFERSIFLRSVSFQNTTEEMIGDVPADANGGSAEDAATARCSWTDTRFKIQIFTNKGASAQVLPPPDGSSVPAPGSVTFVRPGSFPYPITITLDRNGGGLTTKMLYCYGMNDREIQNINSRKFQPENRAFGGTIINPSQIFTNIPVTTAEGGPGGINRGTRRYICKWTNWLAK